MSELKPVRGWESLWRSTFTTEHGGSEWGIEVNYFDLDEKIRLYRDGVRCDEKKAPAIFDLPDGAGQIRVAMSLYGLSDVSLHADGTRRLLQPTPGTGEEWRQRMEREHPRGSRIVSALAWVILVVALVTQIPTYIEIVAGFFGLQTWSFDLPSPVNAVLTVLGVLAGLDRALRHRQNAVLDD